RPQLQRHVLFVRQHDAQVHGPQPGPSRAVAFALTRYWTHQGDMQMPDLYQSAIFCASSAGIPFGTKCGPRPAPFVVHHEQSPTWNFGPTVTSPAFFAASAASA